jgi:hypothetical protein
MIITEEQKTYGCGVATGKGFIDLLNPKFDQINLDDMVTNLSRTYRWRGAVPFTVNQHEALTWLLVERWGGNIETQLEAFTHDGHEYVTTDIPAPFKDGLWFKGRDGSLNRVCYIQENIQYCIREVIGLDASKVDFDLVRRADLFSRDMEYAHWFMAQDTQMTDAYPDYNMGDMRFALDSIVILCNYDAEAYGFDLGNLRNRLNRGN